MELLREYTELDRVLIETAKDNLRQFYSSPASENLCKAYNMKELKDCLASVEEADARILACDNIQRLYVLHQSKILRLNRLSAVLEQISEKPVQINAPVRERAKRNRKALSRSIA
jgi:hypothetical protein